MLQKDFLIREIENFSKFVMALFKKQKIKIEEEAVFTNEDYLWYRLQEMIYNGGVNRGENILFEAIEKEPKLEYLKLAEKFYSEAIKMSDDYLEKQNYSRKEIYESLDQIKIIYEEKYGNFEETELERGVE